MNTKEKIINTTIKLFVKQGFENTPTSQISQDSGVATGTLFHHFKTKEELINESYRYVKKSMKNYIFRELKDNLGLKEKIKVIWIGLIKWGVEKKIERQFLEKFYGSNYIDNITIEQASSGFEQSHNVFLEAKKKGIIRNISTGLFTNLTFSLMHSFCKEFSNKKSISKNDLEASFEMYWGSMKK